MKRVLFAFLVSIISFGLKAQCTSPSNFLGYNITSNSVDIDLSGSGSGPWELQYGVQGFTLGNGTSFQFSGNTTTISGLMAAQSYRVYIRRICGSNTSSWANFSFTTSCGSAISAPVRFDFEEPGWVTPTNPTAYGTMDSCWIVSPQGLHTFWTVGPPHETRLNTGPKGDHTTGFGQFIHLNGLGISLDSTSTVKMPTIDLSSLSNPQLHFWYHLYGADIDSLKLMAKIPSDTAWDILHTFIGQQQVSQTDDWQSLTLSLASYLNNTVDIQFVGYGKGTGVQMALDDLSIHDSSSCQPSTYFRNVSNNDTSVLLDWDAGSSSTHQIEYGKKGFALGNGTRISTNQHPFRISNLSPDTTYVFYIRDDCGSSQFSSWSGPLEVNTDCAPVMAPYFEDFEGAAWPSGGLEHCWDRYNYQDYKWNVGPSGTNWAQSGPGSNNHTPGGSQFIVANRPNQKGKARTSITSPLINLDTITNPELVFWSHMFGLKISAFEISIDSGNGFELLKRIIGPQQLSKSAAWTEQIIALPGYSGKTVKVKFTGIASTNSTALSRIAVDDFSIGEALACRKPTNLQPDELGFTSADISWLSGGSTDWLVRIKPTGGTDSISASATNPMTLTQLQPGTEYTVWVRDSCGAGFVSAWSAPLVFKTHCLPDTTPYFQDFEANQFVVQSSWFSTGSLGPCWERSHELGPIWQPSPATSFPNSYTPQNDHTTGNGKYIGGSMFLGNGTNELTSFTSPHIDLSNLTNPELTFWYYLGGLNSYNNQIQLEIDNGSGWQALTTLYGPQQLSTTDPWLQQVVNLSNFVDDTIRLRFKSIGNNLYATTAVGIDDISIHDVPTCLTPSNLLAYNVGSTKALLSWTSGGASDWVLKHRPDGGSFQYQTTSVNDSFSLNGLSPNTRYEIWVRDSCGPDVSFWHGPIFIKTDCLPTQVPYYEGFNGPAWVEPSSFNDPGDINGCWRRPDSIHNVWIPNTGGSPGSFSGPIGSRTGTGKYMMLESLNSLVGPNTSIVELKTPAIINTGLQQPELNFWYHMYGQQIHNLKVYVEKPDDSRVLIDSLIGQQQGSKNDPWQQRSVSLSAFQGDTLKIVFASKVGNSILSANIAMDDVEIINAICNSPTNLSATNITSNSADLSWTSGSAHSNIQYGTAGFSIGSGTTIHGASPGYNLTGLQPLTTYEYYVQDSCNASNSPWSGPFSFTTSCTPPTADFSHQGPAQTVSFDGSNSTGTTLSYYWEFGDGNTGSGLNPSHTYAAGGMYNVTLITTDSCGLKDTLVKNIQVCEAPKAVINYSRSGLAVSFNGSSSTGAAQYYWDLGSVGVFATDTFTTTFPSRGTYPIYLIVTNACGGSDTSFMNLLICDKPTASFTANIVSTTSAGMKVDFDGTASIFADSFIWDFGDGNTSTTSLTPQHIYATPSLSYTVSLIVMADCGLSDTLSYALSSISLTENSELKMSVYPNPANDRLIVTTPNINLSEADILWFDLSGKQLNVPIISWNNASLEFDVSSLPAGEYYIVNTSSKGGAIKITVQ